MHGKLRITLKASIGLLSVLVLALAGCGSTGGGGTANKDLIIATELPVVGTDATIGLPTQYGVDLAVSQANLPNGYKLTVKHDNYAGASGPDTGLATANVNSLVANSSVVAVVGPFNSGIAKVTIPISNNAGLTFISPANTNPGLTLSQYAEANSINYNLLHPAGKPDAYFRIPGTDVVQGKVDAEVALGAPINAKSAYVVDDNSVYGKGLADFFTQNFTSGGASVVDRAHITAAQVANLNSLATTIKAKNPDIVFFGGVTSGGGGALKKALVDSGYSNPMVGGDGIVDGTGFTGTAGDAAVNTYGTVAAPDISALTSSAAQKFETDYKAFVSGKSNNDLLPYSAMAYDAANIEIQAIKNLINANKDVTRANVRDEVAKIQYPGITGNISFDANGDNAGPKVFSVYTVDQTKQWVFKVQVNG